MSNSAVVGVKLLFNDARLGDWLAGKSSKCVEAIEHWDPDQLLATSDEDLIAQLVEHYAVQCPQLDRDNVEQGANFEEIRNLGADYRPQDIRRRVNVRSFVVPFSGDAEVFRYHPGRGTLNPPAADIDPRANTLTVTRTDEPGNVPDPERIRVDVMTQLDEIGQWLSWAREGIEAHNAHIADPALLGQRRAKILAERNLQGAIGFKIQRRSDADRFAIPMQRKRIAPMQPATNRFEPEPVLADRDYAAAMDVLVTARNALERTPSLAATYDEEQIRDLLLIFLNAQFEGAAAGEVFNKSGKTDILIRVRDRNVFIAECKIWRGPKTVIDGLEQLLDKYLTWRDAKAALLLFIRTRNATDVGIKAVEAIESHGRYKRTTERGGAGERSDFVLHAVDDPAREIKLAFLPFVLPSD